MLQQLWLLFNQLDCCQIHVYVKSTAVPRSRRLYHLFVTNKSTMSSAYRAAPGKHGLNVYHFPEKLTWCWYGISRAPGPLLMVAHGVLCMNCEPAMYVTFCIERVAGLPCQSVNAPADIYVRISPNDMTSLRDRYSTQHCY